MSEQIFKPIIENLQQSKVQNFTLFLMGRSLDSVGNNYTSSKLIDGEGEIITTIFSELFNKNTLARTQVKAKIASMLTKHKRTFYAITLNQRGIESCRFYNGNGKFTLISSNKISHIIGVVHSLDSVRKRVERCQKLVRKFTPQQVEEVANN